MEVEFMARVSIRESFGVGKCLISVFIGALLFCVPSSIAEDTYTTNLNLRLPEVGVEDLVTPWGTKINNNFTILDSSIGGITSGYFKLSGISGGQTAIGGTDAGDDLTFQTTSNASKGSYVFSELSTGLVKSTSGTFSVITDSSTNWDSAYTHSQLTSGNPHSVTKTDVGLSNVENTALSTWAGSLNITTLGIVTTGTLSTGAALADVTMSLGSDADGDIYYRSSNKLTRLPKGTVGQVLTMNSGATAPEWQVSTPYVLRNYIDGLILENDAGDTDHDIKINTGVTTSTDNDVYINLSSALIKRIDANWTAGTNQGGFPSGLSLSANTWYHFFVIVDNDTSTEDACFDTSLTATNCLSDASAYDDYRRVGSVLTDGSSNIIQFKQYGDTFLINPITNTTSIPSSLTLVTITSPLGIICEVILNYIISSSAGTDVYYAPGDAAYEWIQASAVSAAAEKGSVRIMTNTNSQVRHRYASTAPTYELKTRGWIDFRGKQ